MTSRPGIAAKLGLTLGAMTPRRTRGQRTVADGVGAWRRTTRGPAR
jgi:hypothetical protein